MPEIDLYEKKIFHDEDLPVQLSRNTMTHPGEIYCSHWHEQLELHYLLQGAADMELDHKNYHLVPGDLLIANSNELHAGYCTAAPYDCNVIIFNIGDLSPELERQNFIFEHKISKDPVIGKMVQRIFEENEQKCCGYKTICRALVAELLVYLCRWHVEKSLQEQESRKRKIDLERLNIVLTYIDSHLDEQITCGDLAQRICLSQDRFSHLFREQMGRPPMQYINEIRLKKAMVLLQSGTLSVTEIADMTGFRDYNNFGRLFKKRFGCTPYNVKSGRKIL